MKVFVYKNVWGAFFYYDSKQNFPNEASGVFCGIMEQPDPQPEKKTVVKEQVLTGIIKRIMVDVGSDYLYDRFIPTGAKNVKLTYEVEE